MCKAFEDFKAEGRAEGREEGREEGRAEGRTEGQTEGTKNTVLRAYQKMPDMPLSDLAEIANTSVETIKKWILGAGMQI